jgi:hypothetical protein
LDPTGIRLITRLIISNTLLSSSNRNDSSCDVCWMNPIDLSSLSIQRCVVWTLETIAVWSIPWALVLSYQSVAAEETLPLLFLRKAIISYFLSQDNAFHSSGLYKRSKPVVGCWTLLPPCLQNILFAGGCLLLKRVLPSSCTRLVPLKLATLQISVCLLAMRNVRM